MILWFKQQSFAAYAFKTCFLHSSKTGFLLQCLWNIAIIVLILYSYKWLMGLLTIWKWVLGYPTISKWVSQDIQLLQNGSGKIPNYCKMGQSAYPTIAKLVSWDIQPSQNGSGWSGLILDCALRGMMANWLERSACNLESTGLTLVLERRQLLCRVIEQVLCTQFLCNATATVLSRRMHFWTLIEGQYSRQLCCVIVSPLMPMSTFLISINRKWQQQ